MIQPTAPRSPSDQPSIAGLWMIEGRAGHAQDDRTKAIDYARARGLDAAREYVVERGAGESMRRVWRERLLGDARSGLIGAVISPSLTTLAVDAADLARFLREVQAAGLRLLVAEEDVDTAAPGGDLLYRLGMAVGRWAHVGSGVAVLPEGLHLEHATPRIRSAAPFGYEWSEGRLAPNPREAPIRALIYELFSANPDRKSVASTLNARGLRRRGGQRFTERDIRLLIEDPVAKGMFRGNQKRAVDRTRHRDVRDPEKYAYTPVEAIVSADLWADCNAKLLSGNQD